MPQPPLNRMAGILAAMTWRRDLRRDNQLRQRIFLQQIPVLIASLKSAVDANKGVLHPSQKLLVDVQSTFAVLLQERLDHSYLSACYLNVATNPVLGLSFWSRGVEVDSIELALDCFGNARYVWAASDGEALSSDEAAEMICKRVFELATTTVVNETA